MSVENLVSTRLFNSSTAVNALSPIASWWSARKRPRKSCFAKKSFEWNSGLAEERASVCWDLRYFRGALYLKTKLSVFELSDCFTDLSMEGSIFEFYWSVNMMFCYPDKIMLPYSAFIFPPFPSLDSNKESTYSKSTTINFTYVVSPIDILLCSTTLDLIPMLSSNLPFNINLILPVAYHCG